MRKNKGILSKIGGAKFKKSLFEVKILSKQKYEHADGILKEFTLTLKYNKLSKLTSAFNLDENLFEQVFDTGLILSPDGARFLINRINESSIFLKEPLVKVGDLLKSIDDELINTQNIHTVLKRVQSQKSVKLVLQEFYPDVGVGVTSEEIKLTNFLEMLDLKSKIFKIQGEPEELVFSLIFINKNESSSDDSDDFETVFCYPPVESNFLFKLKGSFLTLDSISETAFGTTPIITSIKLNETIYHLSYSLRSADNEFLFLGFNSKYLPTMFGVKYMVENLIKFLDFVFPNFRRAENADQIIGICQMIEIQLRKESENGMVNFEKLLGEPHLIPLPKEIQLRINDCLSELEAMDYRNWNEDLIELFGKFNVIGTSLFYKNSMICSHFNILDTLNVELYLKNYCMKLLYNNCAVKEMVIWQRIFPKDYQSFNIQNDAEINKVFLVIVAHGNLLMCVILEENGNNAPIDPDASEDELKESENYLIYFVEEIEDILDHLKIVGIENLTRIWINSQKRPQCKNFENLQGNNQVNSNALFLMETHKFEFLLGPD